MKSKKQSEWEERFDKRFKYVFEEEGMLNTWQLRKLVFDNLKKFIFQELKTERERIGEEIKEIKNNHGGCCDNCETYDSLDEILKLLEGE